MITDKEHKRHLKQFHKLSDRHILAVETDMPYSDALKVVALSDKIRKAGGTTSRKSTSQTEISLLIQLLFT